MQTPSSEFIEQVRDKRLTAMGLERATVQGMVDARIEARKARDWSKADALRTELTELGIEVRDTAGGSDWRVRIASPEA